MMNKKVVSYLMLALCLAASTVVVGRRQKKVTAQPVSINACKDMKLCKNDPNCACYCAEKGGFRRKTANDKPVYIANDKNGIHCYCKIWDLENYPGPAKRPAGQAQ
jgi:hypothetical protein